MNKDQANEIISLLKQQGAKIDKLSKQNKDLMVRLDQVDDDCSNI